MKKVSFMLAGILLVIMIPRLNAATSDGPKKSFNNRERAWLGVTTQNLTVQLRHFFGVADNVGVLISETAENSPAAIQNLKAGDVIIKADGEWIRNTHDLAEIINDFEPHESLDIIFVRDHQEQQKTIELGVTKHHDRPYYGYRPGRYEIIIPEIDVEIPDIEIPELNREELEILQKELQEELQLHHEELRENLQELQEKLEELKIEYQSDEVI